MIEHKDFILHNAIYIALLEHLLKPGEKLFSSLKKHDGFFIEDKKEGVSFKEFNEVNIEKNLKTLSNFKYIAYLDEKAGYLFYGIDSLGNGVFICIDEKKKYPFFLSDFGNFPKIDKLYSDEFSLSGVCSAIFSLKEILDIDDSKFIEAVGLSFLYFNEGFFLKDTFSEKEIFEKIIYSMKEKKEVIYYLERYKFSKNHVFALLALFSSFEIFNYELDMEELFSFIKKRVG